MKERFIDFFKNVKLIYIVIFGVIIGAVLPAIIFGYITIKLEQNNKITSLKQFGQNTLDTITIATRGHIWDIRQDLAQELINSIAQDARIKHIKIIESATKSIFVQSKNKIEDDGAVYSFKKSVIHEGINIGEVIVEISDSSTQDDILDMQFHFLVIFICQLAVIVIFIVLQLYYKILKPLNRLNTQANYFYQNKLDVEFVWHQNDEIGIVGKNFENARAELLELHEISKEYEQKLVDEVAQKTKELQDLNENLEHKVEEEVAKNKKQNMLMQQQARLAALGEMIGNIAHQWRQPLSAITTYASALQLKSQLDITDKNDIDTTMEGIIKSAKFLSQTIEDFRNFLRSDKTRQHFNISSVIYEIFNIVKATFDSKQITTIFEIDDLIEYDGYPSELSQVILNILNNARDALIQNEIENKFVLIKLFRVNELVYLTITDNAGGIPENIIGKIFDPYFTTKHQQQGTGIGLYMSTQIIKDNFMGKLYAYNGTVDFENEEYTGATFCIELPNVKIED